VDLVGTCFDILNKPMPLMQRHVDIYRHKVIMGIHNKQRVDKTGKRTTESDLESANLSSMDIEINEEIPIDNPSQVVLHKEMFADITGEDRDLRLNQDFLDFNFTHVGRASDSKDLTIHNKFPFSVEVNWALLKVYNKTNNQWVSNPFKIRPEQQRVEAKSSFSFQAEFVPYEPDQYFF